MTDSLALTQPLQGRGRHVVLLSCVKLKGKLRAKSQDLYVSDLFRKSLAYARHLEPDAIYILSAKYHLLELDREIEPYDETLKKMGIASVKAWADVVLGQLGTMTDLQQDRFTVLASERYRRFLLPHMPQHNVPMKGLGIGKQLRYLKEQTQ